MTEIWKSIPDYIGYEASNEGRVRSVDRVLITKRSPNGVKLKGRVLKCQISSKETPYLQVNLGRKCPPLHVHRLVMWAFVGPQPNGIQVRHLDGIHSHNELSNLEYGTPLQNAADAKLHNKDPNGERNPNATLTNAKAREIKNRLSKGESQKALAKEFGVCVSTICGINCGHTWRNA